MVTAQWDIKRPPRHSPHAQKQKGGLVKEEIPPGSGTTSYSRSLCDQKETPVRTKSCCNEQIRMNADDTGPG